MAAIENTIKFTSPISPTDTLDKYPTHFTEYGKGGFRAVADAAARLAITDARREEGMWVYQIDTQTVWTLEDGILDSDWTTVDIGGGGGVGGAVQPYAAGTDYGVGDLLANGGYIYTVVSSIIAANNTQFSDVETYEIGGGIKGYAINTSYSLDDIITHEGSIYKVNAAITAVANTQFTDLDTTQLGIQDAPSDGNIYGRRDNAWEIVTGGGAVTENVLGRSYDFTFADAGAPFLIGGTIPENAYIFSAKVQIDDAFDGSTETTIEIGTQANGTIIMTSDLVEAEVSGIYENALMLKTGSNVTERQITAEISLGTGVTQGSGTILVEYFI